MKNREAYLNGVKVADTLHNELGDRHSIESNRRGSIDVFGSILKKDASLMFRPLDGLLGACLAGGGVIISTNRTLPIQRFTGAHELGHLVMKHPLRLDGDEILNGDPMQADDPVEVEANAFAAEFLLPRWLFAHHARRQGWGAQEMTNPVWVYQLSLRSGASYEATVRSLEKHKIINPENRRELLKIQPKTIKQKLLNNFAPEHWYRDVWVLTEKDQGALLEGQPDDIFLFKLNEKSGAGYLWDVAAVKERGFTVICDERTSASESRAVGSDSQRVLTIMAPKIPKGELCFALRRPWQKQLAAAEKVQLEYDLLGKEIGLPRAQRQEFAAAA